VPSRRAAALSAHNVGVSLSLLDRVREMALALPEVNERRSHGEPCFFVRDKRPLCYFHDDHGGDGRVSLWCPAPLGVQDELVATRAERFFRPSPSARGVFAHWVGVYLDKPPLRASDWVEINEVLREAYHLVAPRSLAMLLDGQRQSRLTGKP
jgi:hypothetical protein